MRSGGSSRSPLRETARPAAALFGTAVAEFGFVTMAASSMLHVPTALYTVKDTPSGDLRAIEYGELLRRVCST